MALINGTGPSPDSNLHNERQEVRFGILWDPKESGWESQDPVIWRSLISQDGDRLD